ncbi:hypothetical protein HYC85_011267 [Camellia sinensis]|uniref:Uncharacterized protein n=1 Tax=Camellia sinensis TaxID=4442 RepID=A0A7J7HBM4_CAMSI|nr:hypothetical protein HYC85_011267 [Camellia sinensis]
MANYHFVYKDMEEASTQWDDIQRKLGNLPPKPPAFKPPSFKPAEDEDPKHKGKARHRECDYHQQLRLSVKCAPSTRKESVLMEANADMNMLKSKRSKRKSAFQKLGTEFSLAAFAFLGLSLKSTIHGSQLQSNFSNLIHKIEFPIQFSVVNYRFPDLYVAVCYVSMKMKECQTEADWRGRGNFGFK